MSVGALSPPAPTVLAAMTPTTHPTTADIPRGTRRQAGFSFIEVVVAGCVLVIAILGHIASVVGQHRTNRVAEEAAVAAETLGRFVERMRADPDWNGLYARLRPLSAESASDTALAHVGPDPSLPTHPATAYYTDFVVPSSLGSATFLVQVPRVPNPGGQHALRENAVAPRYGLPADLNGDSVVNGGSRANDYLALPVVVRIRWGRGQGDLQELVLPTWLRGER